MVDDKLLIITSREGMYATIDALLSAEEIDISNWQPYQNEEYGFEISYPPNWETSGSFEEFSLISPDLAETQSSSDSTDIPSADIEIFVLQNPNRLNIKEFTKTYREGWFTNYLYMNLSGAIQRFSDLGASLEHTPLEAVFISANNHVILFSLHGYTMKNNETLLEIWNQILATFKFIEVRDAETVRAQIANDLREGDIESALEGFAPSEKSMAISTFNTDQLNQLADWIEKAELVEENDNYRIYRYTWTDQSGEHFIEFTMTKDGKGQWLITSW